MYYLHFEVASNFSLFFFRRHFQGLKNRPSTLSLLLCSNGGVRMPGPKLFVRIAAPLFLFTKRQQKHRFDLVLN